MAERNHSRKVMTTIRFLSSGFDKSIAVDVAPGEHRTLLSVAEEHGVPILSNCKSGDCGACLVHIGTAKDSRLACRYQLADEDIVVSFANTLGSF